MGFRIEITAPAITDLAEIVLYFAQDKPQAAAALGNHLLDAVLTLRKMRHKGPAYPHLPNIRKLSVCSLKIFYRVNESQEVAEIIRFWHSARREPDP